MRRPPPANSLEPPQTARKTCRRCGVEKLGNDLWADSSKSDGLRVHCKECNREAKAVHSSEGAAGRGGEERQTKRRCPQGPCPAGQRTEAATKAAPSATASGVEARVRLARLLLTHSHRLSVQAKMLQALGPRECAALLEGESLPEASAELVLERFTQLIEAAAEL